MKVVIISFVIATLLCISCNKEEEGISIYCFDVPEMGGYIARDYNGSTIGIYGNPIIKTGNSSGNQLFLYPIPVGGFHNSFSIMTQSENSEKRLWITRAKLNNRISPSSVNGGMININVTGNYLYDTVFTSRYLHLNKNILPEGYYRVYLEINNEVFYDNLVITDEEILN